MIAYQNINKEKSPRHLEKNAGQVVGDHIRLEVKLRTELHLTRIAGGSDHSE
jgi:hypothetical protein